MISQIIDGGAIEADGGASAPVGPTVATPLHNNILLIVTANDSYCHCINYI